MAKIEPYVGTSIHEGSKQKIEKQIVFWIKIGFGTVVSFDDFDLGFKGDIDVPPFYKGPLNLELSLTDKNPSAVSGPCEISVNGSKDPNAVYSVVSSKTIKISAHISGKAETIELSQSGKDTTIKLSGTVSQTAKLAPA